MSSRGVSRIATLLAVLGAFVLLPATASAVRVGSTCTAQTLGPNLIFNRSHVAPFDGVITSWGTTTSQSLVIDSPMLLKLKIVSGAPPGTMTVVGESAPQQLVNGINEFPTRISIRAGEFFGTWAASSPTSGSPYCNSGGDDFFYSEPLTDIPVGNSFEIDSAMGIEHAVHVDIERDVDGDGFGDESQDGCPSSALSQSVDNCPPPPVSTFGAVSSSGYTLFLTAKLPTTVKLEGTVKSPGGLFAINSKSLTLVPYKLNTLNLTFNKALRKAIRASSKRKRLKLKMTLHGGTPSVPIKSFSAKLK